MKMCFKNLLSKLGGLAVLTWWILLALGMGAITQRSPSIDWLVVCGLVGGWMLVGVIAFISIIIGLIILTHYWEYQ